MNGNPFFVQPGGDLRQGLSGLGQTFQQIGERNREAEAAQRAAEKFARIKTEAMAAYQSGDPGQIAQFNINNPEMAEAMNITEMAAHRDEETLNNSLDSSYSFLANPTRDNAMKLVSQRKKMLISKGVPPEQQQETDSFMQRFDADPDALIRETEGRLAAVDTERFVKYREAIGKPVDGGAGSGVTVGAQEILEDGTVIQSLKGGGTKVYDPEGNELKGRARRDAVQIGRAEKVSNLRKAAGGKRAASLEEEFKLKGKVEANIISSKDAAKASSAAFDKVEKIYQNIENLNEAVRLVEVEGASTGAIMDRLPSMRSAAVKLDNLQGRLGLDVIGNTTFGALSEAELKFALATALPQRLEGPALVDWAKKKALAQEKLADYLESAAIYLGTPGNTKVGWLETQRNKVGDKYGRTQTVAPENLADMSDDDLLRAAGMQ